MTRPVVLLALTEGEARALRSLALKGRVFMSVDKSFLRRPAERAAAHGALTKLRQLQPEQA